MSLSLNTIVKVRLTQDGIRRHREFYRSFMPEKLFDEYYQPPDKDGVLRTELWKVMPINTITQRAVMAVLDWPFIHWREAIKLWNPFIPYQHMAKEPTTATVVAYEEFKHLFRPTPLEVTLDKLEQLAGIRGEPFVRGDYGI